MTPKQIIAAIREMRDRDNLSAIINAAESRDCHLSNLESDERRKRAWSNFSHLKKGNTVFIHKNPGTNGPYVGMWGKQLRVKQVKMRAKELILDAPGHKTWKLTALTALDLKLSETPTAEAFHNTLAGDDTLARERKPQ